MKFLSHSLLAAFQVALAGALLAAAKLLPGFLPERFWPLAAGLCFALVGSVLEFTRLRGRVLFLPVWFVGWGLVCYALFALGGWWILAGLLTSVGTVFAGLIAIANAEDAKQWAAAPAALVDLKAAAVLEDADGVWASASRALFVPAGDLSPEVCGHDAQVLRLVQPFQQRAAPALAPELATLLALLEAGAQRSQGTFLPKEAYDPVVKFLQRQRAGPKPG